MRTDEEEGDVETWLTRPSRPRDNGDRRVEIPPVHGPRNLVSLGKTYVRGERAR